MTVLNLVTVEDWAAAAFGDNLNDAVWVWSSKDLPTQVATQPIPDGVIARIAEGVNLRWFLSNHVVPLDQRTRVIPLVHSAHLRASAHQALSFEECDVQEWNTLLPLVSQGQATTLLSTVRMSRRIRNRTSLVQQMWRTGDERTRAALAAAVLLATRPEDRTDAWLDFTTVATDPSPLVRAAGLRNSSFQPRVMRLGLSVDLYDLLYGLLTDEDETVRIAARRHARIDLIRTDRVPQAIRDAAKSRDTVPGGLWPDWFTDPSPRVRAAMIDPRYHRTTDVAGLLTRLFTDPDPMVRARVLAAADVPSEVIEAGSRDEVARVRAAAAKAAGVPVETLIRLSEDPVRSVQRAAGLRLVAALAG